MDFGLKNRRALVLGATRGLGRGIAEMLAAEGATVGVCGRDSVRADEVAAEIAARSGATVQGFAVNLMDEVSVDALCASVEAVFDGVDLLVINGGGPPPGPLTEVGEDVWRTQFQAMFLSHCRITSRFLPGMRTRKWGRILICSSSGAVQPIPALGISNTMRAALIAWAKTLSNEVARDGVTVNTIMPGRIKTERVDELDQAAAERQGKSVDEIVAASRATIPMGRYGEVEEYAAVAAFLLSAPASYVTGCVVRADGGLIRGT